MFSRVKLTQIIKLKDLGIDEEENIASLQFAKEYNL